MLERESDEVREGDWISEGGFKSFDNRYAGGSFFGQCMAWFDDGQMLVRFARRYPRENEKEEEDHSDHKAFRSRCNKQDMWHGMVGTHPLQQKTRVADVSRVDHYGYGMIIQPASDCPQPFHIWQAWNFLSARPKIQNCNT